MMENFILTPLQGSNSKNGFQHRAAPYANIFRPFRACFELFHFKHRASPYANISRPCRAQINISRPFRAKNKHQNLKLWIILHKSL